MLKHRLQGLLEPRRCGCLRGTHQEQACPPRGCQTLACTVLLLPYPRPHHTHVLSFLQASSPSLCLKIPACEGPESLLPTVTLSAQSVPHSQGLLSGSHALTLDRPWRIQDPDSLPPQTLGQCLLIVSPHLLTAPFVCLRVAIGRVPLTLWGVRIVWRHDEGRIPGEQSSNAEPGSSPAINISCSM